MYIFFLTRPSHQTGSLQQVERPRSQGENHPEQGRHSNQTRTHASVRGSVLESVSAGSRSGATTRVRRIPLVQALRQIHEL